MNINDLPFLIHILLGQLYILRVNRSDLLDELFVFLIDHFLVSLTDLQLVDLFTDLGIQVRSALQFLYDRVVLLEF